MANSNKKADLPQVLQAEHYEGHAPSSKSRSKFEQHKLKFIGGGVALLCVIAMGFPVETVVVAPGRVVPSDHVKPVQHLEGGIVNEVKVKDGQRVTKGQPLVEIDLGGNSLNLEELTSRNAALTATRTRLNAESQGKHLTREDFDKDIDPSVFQAEMGAYKARMLEHQGQLAAFKSNLEQARSRQMEQQAKLSGLQERVSLYQKELEISEQLLKERLIPQLEVLEKRRQMETVRTELAVTKQAVLSGAAGITEAQGKLAEAEGAFRRRASDELTAAERQLASAAEDLTRAKNQRARTTDRAPSDGVVKGLKNPSPGWVVRPGEQIMEIVPDEAKIIVEARLNPNDRGFIEVGQKARVKISAYDFLRYGSVDGVVTPVGADADRDQNMPGTPPFYKLQVSTDLSFIGKPENKITAGMESEVDLLVGRDPFIWYLLRPVLKVQRQAFREP